MKIGIIGNGFVGNAIFQNFKDKVETKVFDVEPKRCYNSLEDVLFDSVKTGVISDKRIGLSHTKVPGPDGLMGFGGYCFPKDINALINTLKEKQIDSSLFDTVWQYNKKVRKE